jgi:hypothetical protein
MDGNRERRMKRKMWRRGKDKCQSKGSDRKLTFGAGFFFVPHEGKLHHSTIPPLIPYSWVLNVGYALISHDIGRGEHW